MKRALILFLSTLMLSVGVLAQEDLKARSRSQKRSLPSIDKKKLSSMRKKIKRKKVKQLKKERREVTKDVAKTGKVNKKRNQRKRRLAILRAARNRLNQNNTTD